jgi:anti-sigma B factor antagonist
METRTMRIAQRTNGDVTILDVSGRLTIGEAASGLHEAVRGLVAGGHPKIVLNLAETSYVDTRGLVAMASGQERARVQGGDLKLLSLPDKVKDLLHVARFLSVFDIFDDEAKAVSAFDRR